VNKVFHRTFYHTLLQEPSVTQAHSVWVMENVVIHIEKSENQHKTGSWIHVDDGIFRHPHVVGLRHAWLKEI
jgi:hypothetical protein